MSSLLVASLSLSSSSRPTSADDCKNGGWATYTNPTFKNQGDCIQFVNTAK